jgi:hypothetical protein
MIIQPGDLVQVDPESKFKRYWACLIFVENIDEEEDTLKGHIVIPDDRGTKLEEVIIPLDEVEYLTTPKWAPVICLTNRERNIRP